MTFEEVDGSQIADSQSLPGEVLSLGASLVGLADVSPVASLPYPDLTRALSMAVQLTPDVIEAVRAGPTAEYALEYERVNVRLNQIADATCERIRALGYQAQFFPATIIRSALESEYQRDLRVQFQHKTAATRAGLGWIGKSALLITPEHGPRLRLVTVFTDMPFVTGKPITQSRCGDCTECVDACPGAAIKGQSWEVGVSRESLFDPHLCRATSQRVTRQRTGQEGPCGICVAVCPWGRRSSGG